MKVVFNADDYGLTRGVTDGIIQSYKNGVVRSTTMMMNGLAVDFAVEQAKLNPGLKIGIHLVLSWGKPISSDVNDLLNKEGTFKFHSTFDSQNKPNIEQVEKEWRAQIEAFLKTGIPLHHIDSHHHVHSWGILKDLVIKLAKEFNVPVRSVPSLQDHPDILLTESLWLDFYAEGVHKHVFEDIKNLDVKSVEVMTHPAIVDEELRQISSYTDLRTLELEILTNLNVPDWAKIDY